ncbi:MAG: apolipoprotein N-acyltransferase, partial [Planctomycetota bacterium]
ELAGEQPPAAESQRGVIPWCDRPLESALIAALAIIGALTYGHQRQQQVQQVQQQARSLPVVAVEEATGSSATAAISRSSSDSLHIALIQNSIDTVFDYNEERNRRTFERYREQTLEVCRAHPELDLVIWPESMFTENSPEFLVEDPQLRARIADRLRAFETKVRLLARETADVRGDDVRGDEGVHLVVGTITIDATQTNRRPREYNSALLIHPSGQVVDRYYKQHLVMFGEYIPLGETFPQLYQWVGMGGATPGDRPAAFTVKGHKLCPNICFETMVPHVIGSQLRDLRKSEKVADILINLTNDGWFWGSTILDMHFQAGIFRAIEARRPLVVAANTGITAWIDGSGRVVDQLPRRQPGVLIATVTKDGRSSWYERWGDWPLVWLVMLFYGWLTVRHRRVSRRAVPR